MGTKSAKEPDPSYTEEEFIRCKKNEAKAALTNTLKDLKSAITRSSDPRAWVSQYPKSTMALATSAAFLAAGGHKPMVKKGQKFLRHHPKLRRKVVPATQRVKDLLKQNLANPKLYSSAFSAFRKFVFI